LTELSLLAALNRRGVKYRHHLFSPVTTIWGFLSQVLSEGHSCRDAVSRIPAPRAAKAKHLIGLDREACLFWQTGRSPEAGGDLEQLLERTTALIWLFGTHVLQLVADYVGRLLFTTVVFADVMLRVTRAVWQREKQSHQSEAATGHGQVMSRVDRFLDRA
jgi:hypothetical protein